MKLEPILDENDEPTGYWRDPLTGEVFTLADDWDDLDVPWDEDDRYEDLTLSIVGD